MSGTATSNRSTSKIDQVIGNRIRTRRLEIDMSQEQLADALGVTFQQVQKYEKGINRVSASRLLDIADVLGIPVVKFYERLSKRDTSSGSPSMLDDGFSNQLSSVLVNLSEEGRQLLLDTARTFARQDRLKRRK